MLVARHVVLDEAEEARRQQEECDDIGQNRECRGSVREEPERCAGIAEIHGDDDHAEARNGIGPLVELEDLVLHLGVADQIAHDHFDLRIDAAGGREAEQEHAERKDDAADGADTGFKGGQGQRCAVQTAVPNTGDEDDDAGDRADDKGINENLEDAHHALLDGVIDLGGGVDHRSGAPTGLIAEHRAGHTGLDGQRNGGTHEAAGRGGAVERAVEHELEHRRDLRGIAEHDEKTRKDVENAHKGDHRHGELADGLEAAADHDVQCDRVDDADDHHVDIEGVGDRFRDGVGLDIDEVAGQKAEGEDKAHNFENAFPLLFDAKTLFHVVVRAAIGFVVGVFRAVVDGQRDLGHLDDHTEKTGDPHPEHGTRAADGDGRGNAADIADANGGAECGAHSFKWGENAGVVLVLLFAVENAVERMLHGHTEAAELEKARASSNVNADSKNQNNEWKTP